MNYQNNHNEPILLIGKRFLNKYTLQKKLGEGSFGALYKASSNEGDFALKFEFKSRDNNLLETEAKILEHLQDFGIPFYKDFFTTRDFNVLVMELLGKSLEDLLHLTNEKKFSIRCTANIAIQIIDILSRVHDKYFIHRDIKPDNFVCGYAKNNKYIYMIDFGLAKKYRSRTTHKHNPLICGKKLTGTARYASINALSGLEQSRRDDLESVAYSLVYMAKGCLPWQGLRAKKKDDRYKIILEKKKKISSEELCQDLPRQFKEFTNIIKKLQYEEDPNYSYYKRLFKSVLEEIHCEYDKYCDWLDQINMNTRRRIGSISFSAENKKYKKVNNICINGEGSAKNEVNNNENNNNNNNQNNEMKMKISINPGEENNQKDEDNMAVKLQASKMDINSREPQDGDTKINKEDVFKTIEREECEKSNIILSNKFQRHESKKASGLNILTINCRQNTNNNHSGTIGHLPQKKK